MLIIEQAGRTALRWADMLRRLGLELAAANREGDELPSFGIARVCLSCRRWKECEAWLDHGGEPFGYRRFCKNATYFDELKDG